MNKTSSLHHSRSKARRKTLFPLSPVAVHKHQALVAYDLHRNCGLPIYAVRQVLKCTPEKARQLVARAERLKREHAKRCTCPARVDVTFTGHLPDCPTHEQP